MSVSLLLLRWFFFLFHGLKCAIFCTKQKLGQHCTRIFLWAFNFILNYPWYTNIFILSRSFSVSRCLILLLSPSSLSPFLSSTLSLFLPFALSPFCSFSLLMSWKFALSKVLELRMKAASKNGCERIRRGWIEIRERKFSLTHLTITRINGFLTANESQRQEIVGFKDEEKLQEAFTIRSLINVATMLSEIKSTKSFSSQSLHSFGKRTNQTECMNWIHKLLSTRSFKQCN